MYKFILKPPLVTIFCNHIRKVAYFFHSKLIDDLLKKVGNPGYIVQITIIFSYLFWFILDLTMPFNKITYVSLMHLNKHRRCIFFILQKFPYVIYLNDMRIEIMNKNKVMYA